MSKVQELKKGRVTPALDTPTNLSAEAVRAMSEALNAILADNQGDHRGDAGGS